MATIIKNANATTNTVTVSLDLIVKMAQMDERISILRRMASKEDGVLMCKDVLEIIGEEKEA